jgi:DNA-directed RNA polymerase specialized sigma24 family protein
MSEAAQIDVARCEVLAQRGAAGDATACRELVEHLWPAWVRMVAASRSMGALPRSDDHVHDVVARLVEKIGRADGRGLRLYPPWRERNPGKTFEDWIRIVTANAIRDYVREKLGDTRNAEPRDASAKRLLNEFASSGVIEKMGKRPPITAAQTARELLEFAQQHVTEEQYSALTQWIEGSTFEEIASGHGSSDPELARRLVRAAVAVLRRHFASDVEP